MEPHKTAITSFDTNHATYDKFRPSFDDKIVDAFLSDLLLRERTTNKYYTDKRILEIAAGTGKFTKSLVARGWDGANDNLIVVEPSSGMLESFRRNLPGVRAYKSSSYQIPLADNSVDAVIVAQGFHWFSDLESLKEINRVLVKDGTFGCIWNFDCPSVEAQGLSGDATVRYIFAGDNTNFTNLVESTPNSPTKPFDIATEFFRQSKWAVPVGQYVYSFDTQVPQYRRGDWRRLLDSTESHEYFSSISHENFAFLSEEIEWDAVYKLWETRSYITKLSESEKASIKAHIEHLLRQNTTEADLKEADGKIMLTRTVGCHTVVTRAIK
ncbi:Methyltransferase type 11 domain-containing protein [[Candida] zeylanoides]